MRYELNDREWAAIKPMLPNKPRGVPRVNDRRVLNGIFWVLRSGTSKPHLYRISCPCVGADCDPASMARSHPTDR
jgi:transposase